MKIYVALKRDEEFFFMYCIKLFNFFTIKWNYRSAFAAY